MFIYKHWLSNYKSRSYLLPANPKCYKHSLNYHWTMASLEHTSNIHQQWSGTGKHQMGEPFQHRKHGQYQAGALWIERGEFFNEIKIIVKKINNQVWKLQNWMQIDYHKLQYLVSQLSHDPVTATCLPPWFHESFTRFNFSSTMLSPCTVCWKYAWVWACTASPDLGWGAKGFWKTELDMKF